MTANTITPSRLETLEDILTAALRVTTRVRLQSLAGEITVEDAAETINCMVESVTRFCGDAEEPVAAFRYFRDYNTFWKMPATGKGFVRIDPAERWDDSICDLSDMFKDQDVNEITAEEGEL